ncbi:G/U mismatch-specific uracil DNA glycosylase [Botrytis cinerea]
MLISTLKSYRSPNNMGKQLNSKYFKTEETEADAANNITAPSFQGKLDLSSFTYSPNPPSRSRRQSPQINSRNLLLEASASKAALSSLNQDSYTEAPNVTTDSQSEFKRNRLEAWNCKLSEQATHEHGNHGFGMTYNEAELSSPEQHDRLIKIELRGDCTPSPMTLPMPTSVQKRQSSTMCPSEVPKHANASPSPSKRRLEPLSASPASNPSPAKKRRSRAGGGYKPPSHYAHLSFLPDVISSDLLCLFVGLNPGLLTAQVGHAYAHPSNRFWKILYSSGCTTRLLKAEDDVKLPELYSLGNTNIVERPTRNGGELSKKEMDEGVSSLEEKIRIYRPEAVALVGKGIWESVWRVKKGKAMAKDEFRYGWQSEEENLGVVEGEDSWGELGFLWHLVHLGWQHHYRLRKRSRYGGNWALGLSKEEKKEMA